MIKRQRLFCVFFYLILGIGTTHILIGYTRPMDDFEFGHLRMFYFASKKVCSISFFQKNSSEEKFNSISRPLLLGFKNVYEIPDTLRIIDSNLSLNSQLEYICKKNSESHSESLYFDYFCGSPQGWTQLENKRRACP